MKKQPLISVIVASYNYAKYIKETLDSLIRQTNKSLKLLLWMMEAEIKAFL